MTHIPGRNCAATVVLEEWLVFKLASGNWPIHSFPSPDTICRSSCLESITIINSYLHKNKGSSVFQTWWNTAWDVYTLKPFLGKKVKECSRSHCNELRIGAPALWNPLSKRLQDLLGQMENLETTCWQSSEIFVEKLRRQREAKRLCQRNIFTMLEPILLFSFRYPSVIAVPG